MMQPARDYTGNKEQNQDWNPGSLIPGACLTETGPHRVNEVETVSKTPTESLLLHKKVNLFF